MTDTRVVVVLEYRVPAGMQAEDFQEIVRTVDQWQPPKPLVGAELVGMSAAVADAADRVMAVFEPGEQP